MSYNVDYKVSTPAPNDKVFLFDGNKVCCRLDDNEIGLPAYSQITGLQDLMLQYLFSIDEEKYFMLKSNYLSAASPTDGYEWNDWGIFRTARPQHLAFATITAQQLYHWYNNNTYCGQCGKETVHSETERACVCNECDLVFYPKISPVVIVAVTNGEQLLVTRYKGRPFRMYALVAGFVEIGESLEDTVRREVFEETGVHVKNIRYYRSQPWGFTSTLLAGFYCELDGEPDIVLDDNELSEATWLHRDDIPPAEHSIALTAEMMEMFRLGKDRSGSGSENE